MIGMRRIQIMVSATRFGARGQLRRGRETLWCGPLRYTEEAARRRRSRSPTPSGAGAAEVMGGLGGRGVLRRRARITGAVFDEMRVPQPGADPEPRQASDIRAFLDMHTRRVTTRCAPAKYSSSNEKPARRSLLTRVSPRRDCGSCGRSRDKFRRPTLSPVILRWSTGE